MDTPAPDNKPDAKTETGKGSETPTSADTATPAPESAKPAKDQTPGADGKVLQDDKEGYLYQPHKVETPEAKHTKAKRLINPKVLIPGSIIIILLIAGLVYLILKPKSATEKSLNKAGISLQNVSSETMKNLAAAIGIGQPKQTLTIAADTVFKNQVTFEKGFTANGLINAASGIKISGAASADSLNISSNLSVNGTTSLQGTVDVKNQLNVGGPLNVTGSGSFAGNINVKGSATIGGSLSINGTFAVGTITVQTITVSQSLTVNGHIVSGGSAPSISATSRIGSGGNASVSGNDTAGTITILTGSSPTCGPSGNGQWATITFSRAFSSVPKVILSPVGFNSAKIEISAIRTPQNFTISCNLTPLPGTPYAYDYIVVE